MKQLNCPDRLADNVKMLCGEVQISDMFLFYVQLGVKVKVCNVCIEGITEGRCSIFVQRMFSKANARAKYF